MEQKGLLSILHQAMEIEVTGREFYLVTAAHTEDPQGKEEFLKLAREEEDHFLALQKSYEAIEGEQGVLWDPPDATTSALAPFFAHALPERAAKMNFEISALSIGVMLEKNSFEFYAKMAIEVNDPQAQAMFRDLEEWEKTHYHNLLQQMELLKRDSWALNRFAPF
ncbi:MAG: ferritin family protein [Coprothermobacterota bacterium]|nr:ferritin family protein [Coprothermobacterota bacterium]